MNFLAFLKLLINIFMSFYSIHWMRDLFNMRRHFPANYGFFKVFFVFKVSDKSLVAEAGGKNLSDPLWTFMHSSLWKLPNQKQTMKCMVCWKGGTNAKMTYIQHRQSQLRERQFSVALSSVVELGMWCCMCRSASSNTHNGWSDILLSESDSFHAHLVE